MMIIRWKLFFRKKKREKVRDGRGLKEREGDKVVFAVLLKHKMGLFYGQERRSNRGKR